MAGSCSFAVATAGDAHGLLVWFDCETGPGVGFSNSPSTGRESLYQRGFFPWSEPVSLEVGDEVKVSLRADPVGSDYIYCWDTDVSRGNESSSPMVSFRQTDFLGNPLSSEWRRKTGASFSPEPNDESRIDKAILEAFFVGTTLEGISRDLSERYPQRFPDWRKALTRVGEMSMRYSL